MFDVVINFLSKTANAVAHRYCGRAQKYREHLDEGTAHEKQGAELEDQRHHGSKKKIFHADNAVAGHYQEALDAYLAAKNLYPNQALAYFVIGNLYYRLALLQKEEDEKINYLLQAEEALKQGFENLEKYDAFTHFGMKKIIELERNGEKRFRALLKDCGKYLTVAPLLIEIRRRRAIAQQRAKPAQVNINPLKQDPVPPAPANGPKDNPVAPANPMVVRHVEGAGGSKAFKPLFKKHSHGSSSGPKKRNTQIPPADPPSGISRFDAKHPTVPPPPEKRDRTPINPAAHAAPLRIVVHGVERGFGEKLTLDGKIASLINIAQGFNRLNLDSPSDQRVRKDKLDAFLKILLSIEVTEAFQKRVELNQLNAELNKCPIEMFDGTILAFHRSISVYGIRKLLDLIKTIEQQNQAFLVKGSMAANYIFDTEFLPRDLDGHVVCMDDVKKIGDEKLKPVTKLNTLATALQGLKYDCKENKEYQNAMVKGEVDNFPVDVTLGSSNYNPNSDPIPFTRSNLHLKADGKISLTDFDDKVFARLRRKEYSIDIKMIAERRFLVKGVFFRCLKYYDKLKVGKAGGFVLDQDASKLFMDRSWLRDTFFQLPHDRDKQKTLAFYYQSELRKLAFEGYFNHTMALIMINAFINRVIGVYGLRINNQDSSIGKLLIESVAAKSGKEAVNALQDAIWACLAKHFVDKTILPALINLQPAHLPVTAQPYIPAASAIAPAPALVYRPY